MARKSSLLKQTIFVLAFFILALYAFVNTFISPSVGADAAKNDDNVSSFSKLNFGSGSFSSKSSKVKVYMYDLPRKFTYGIIEQHSMARGGVVSPVDDVSTLKYPGHQHMGEWYLFSDLNRPESERVGSPIMKVTDPDEADLFYVPVFSSLSLVVNVGGPAGAHRYSDEEMQEELVEWLEKQEHWKRNNGRDHVIIAGDPNAMIRVIDRIKNAVLLVSDFGRLRYDQGSLVKDVIIPYSHRINTYKGEPAVQDRKNLLFFMGNRYRKDVSTY